MTKKQDYRDLGRVKIQVYKDMIVTYGEFIEALKEIGYKDESTNDYFRYKKNSLASLINMPIKPLDEPMWTPNFFNYSQSLFLRGDIKSPDDLAKIIEKNREKAKKETITY